jgi:hypothetical protein
MCTFWKILKKSFLIIKPSRCTNFSNFSVPSSSCSKAVYKPVWYIPLLCVQWKTPDDGQRNCPKHAVSFQNKLEKLVHLHGFIIRICHNARSHECKIQTVLLINNAGTYLVNIIWISLKRWERLLMWQGHCVIFHIVVHLRFVGKHDAWLWYAVTYELSVSDLCNTTRHAEHIFMKCIGNIIKICWAISISILKIYKIWYELLVIHELYSADMD